MKKFEVRFVDSNDQWYDHVFESNDIDTLIKLFNDQRFIYLPGEVYNVHSKKYRSHTFLNRDSITSITIEEVLFDETTWNL